MEYDMDIKEFSCFQYNMEFLVLMEYNMDIKEFSCF